MSTSQPADKAAGRHVAEVPPETAPPENVQELRQEIADTREQLGETVQQLAAKADVKAQAREKASDLANQVKSKVKVAHAQATARAETMRDQIAGKAGEAGLSSDSLAKVAKVAKEEVGLPLATACAPVWQAAPEPVRQAVGKAATGAKQRRGPIMAAVGVLVLGYLMLRRRRRR